MWDDFSVDLEMLKAYFQGIATEGLWGFDRPSAGLLLFHINMWVCFSNYSICYFFDSQIISENKFQQGSDLVFFRSAEQVHLANRRDFCLLFTISTEFQRFRQLNASVSHSFRPCIRMI